METIGPLLGIGLTCLILTYLVLGSNPLYRLALHLFLGALVGYSFGVVVRDVFIGMVLSELLISPLAVVAPVVLGLLLLFKGFPKYAYVGNVAVAYLVGVGTAVALSGALLGTLVPQLGATARALSGDSPAGGLFVVAGTVCTLMAFNFAAPRYGGLGGVWTQVVGALGWVGRVLLILAAGVAFAGALTTSLSLLIGRIQYIIAFFVNL